MKQLAIDAIVALLLIALVWFIANILGIPYGGLIVAVFAVLCLLFLIKRHA